jgi:hypothetical protein
MKSNYYLNVDLVSKKKFSPDDLEKIKNDLELNEDFFDLCSILSESISINFSNHIEIYVEDVEFDSDKMNEVEEFVTVIDSTISGGWGNDSKIEWTSEYPNISYLWFKNDEDWDLVTKDHDRGVLGESEEWDSKDSDYGYGADLDPEDNW